MTNSNNITRNDKQQNQLKKLYTELIDNKANALDIDGIINVIFATPNPQTAISLILGIEDPIILPSNALIGIEVQFMEDPIYTLEDEGMRRIEVMTTFISYDIFNEIVNFTYIHPKSLMVINGSVSQDLWMAASRRIDESTNYYDITEGVMDSIYDYINQFKKRLEKEKETTLIKQRVNEFVNEA